MTAVHSDDLVRVLVVDGGDEQAARILELLATLDRAYHVVPVRGLAAGIAALTRQPLDVCLLDHRLREGGGLEALTEVTSMVPILVVGGPDGDDHERAAIGAGASDYLSAGELDARLLQRSMRHAIERRRTLVARRRLEASLAAADRMVTVGTLAAGVAHEVNNPLAAVITNLEVIAERAGGGELDAAIGDARNAAEQIRHIVRELKMLSRADDERREPVDLHQALGSALRISANEIRHRATVIRDFAAVPPVIGNESRLGQVFLNLLINAAQAIVEGQAAANQIRVSTRTDPGGEARIEISDTGAGIEAGQLQRVFDAFYTTKPIGVGTGLGLSICQRIVVAMGGRIEVASVPGQGSTFSVVLPPAPAAVVTPTPPPLVGDATRRGRILVIDDDPMIGRSIRRFLATRHDVTAVASGRDGVDHIRGGEIFDLILCDMMMPEMTGIDVHRELEALDPAVAARIVFMTGGAFAPSAKAFLDQTGIRKIDKPFDGAVLRGLIAERLG